MIYVDLDLVSICLELCFYKKFSKFYLNYTLNFVYFMNLPFGVCKNASLMLSLALVVS